MFWTSPQAESRLSIAKAFTSLTIVTLVSGALGLLVAARATFAAALGCFSRIQKFLLLDERADYRTLVTAHCPPKEQPVKDIELNPLSTAAVELRKASFRASDGTVFLKNADLCVKNGSCHIITGPVGSGKSSALKAILGELHLTGGSAHVKEDLSVAYCGQTPWLRNVSILENIVGGAEFGFDAEWYARVISACALDRDFALVPHWEAKAVGTRGLSLSRG